MAKKLTLRIEVCLGSGLRLATKELALPDELRRWLGKAQASDSVESIVGNQSDLAAELKRSLKGRDKRRAA